MEAEARPRWIHLQVKGRGLDGFLLVAGQPRKAVGERVGDAEKKRTLPRCRSRQQNLLLGFRFVWLEGVKSRAHRLKVQVNRWTTRRIPFEKQIPFGCRGYRRQREAESG